MTVTVNFHLLITVTTLSISSIFTTFAVDEAFPSILSTFGVATKHSDYLKPIRCEVYGGERKIFDISHRYTPEMPVWESSKGLGKFLRLAVSMKNGSEANISEMKLSVHSGTHVDAPCHFHDHYYDSGFDSDSLDLQILNAEVMESLNIPKGVRRVLFKTLNTDRI
ncbi:PREDICTED: uncharacterized protein LOC104777570 isoform X2 [Camelina sativa]|uniref:Uncharacterized protein LOC104777570 isoform X2 n=1 Tax=Camelina sativa TaxID=90675 RepID=A0ABM0YFH5_CAMSA|nr:PREDICTED: uncharacterized protein LOC104777570 isoform X2 [Camelina sativa]